MAGGRRKNIITSRRRRTDEGEDDDDAETGSLDYGSQSEASFLTETNSQREDESEAGSQLQQQNSHTQSTPQGQEIPDRRTGNKRNTKTGTVSSSKNHAGPKALFKPASDTNVMTNGLQVPDGDAAQEVVSFEQTQAGFSENGIHQAASIPVQRAPLGPRRGHMTGPGLSRGHDMGFPSRAGQQTQEFDRHGDFGGAGMGRQPGRGRGRGWVGPKQPFLGQSSTSARWDHDLHDTVANAAPIQNRRQGDFREQKPTDRLVPGAGAASNSLSRTLIIGHVTLRVKLPGMMDPVQYQKTPLKSYIRLPDLRPPLRRDKPVRISLPEHTPRYIFPNPQRSFIFIPRAQRPNQQGGRYRRRGSSQYGSRRNSTFGGSANASTIGMSRRSSLARDALVSPTGSIMSKTPLGGLAGGSRPVVRLPANPVPQAMAVGGASGEVLIDGSNGSSAVTGTPIPSYPLPAAPAFREHRGSQLPMYQPRPQKAVSVGKIESPPGPKSFHAPQQQGQQPFHQQIPPHHANGAYDVTDTQNGEVPTHGQPPYGFTTHPGAATPSTHLPERAVDAQPFQPGQMPVFQSAYAMQPVYYYPMPDNQGVSYGHEHGMMPPMYVQPTQHGSYLVPMLLPPNIPPGADGSQGQLAHESNGMVYYYEPTPFSGGGESMQAGGYRVPDPEAQPFFYPNEPPPGLYYPPS